MAKEKSKRHKKADIINLMKHLSRTSLPEIAFVSSFILSRYLTNADFSYPVEIILPIIVFSTVATFVYYISKQIIKDVFATHITTLALIYMIYSEDPILKNINKQIKNILPETFDTDFTISLMGIIFILIICIVTGWFVAKLVKKLPTELYKQSYKIVLFIIAFIFGWQMTKTSYYLFTVRHQLAYSANTQIPFQDTSKPLTKPDIYYVVLDRYANDETLKNIYGFDNSKFYDTLQNLNFVNQTNAFANYPFTMSSITSTLAMTYSSQLNKKFGNDKNQTAFPYRSILSNAPVVQILKENGYQYNQISSWWDFTRVGIKADYEPTKSFRFTVFGKQFWLSDLSRDIINKSALSDLFKKGLEINGKVVIKYDLNRNPRQNFEAQLNAITDISGSKHKTNPQFSFAHILVPHDPYIFTADGSEPEYDSERNDIGLDEYTKYTNQITYLNKRIIETISNIRKNSPDAVIVVQADEGPYPKEFRYNITQNNYYDPAKLPLPQLKQKFGILASYYMPGVDAKTVNEKIIGSVNPFRFVLSHYMNYDIKPLPDCHFSTGNKYTVYKYKNVTDKLNGKKTNNCDTYK